MGASCFHCVTVTHTRQGMNSLLESQGLSQCTLRGKIGKAPPLCSLSISHPANHQRLIPQDEVVTTSSTCPIGAHMCWIRSQAMIAILKSAACVQTSVWPQFLIERDKCLSRFQFSHISDRAKVSHLRRPALLFSKWSMSVRGGT